MRNKDELRARKKRVEEMRDSYFVAMAGLNFKEERPGVGRS